MTDKECVESNGRYKFILNDVIVKIKILKYINIKTEIKLLKTTTKKDSDTV